MKQQDKALTDMHESMGRYKKQMFDSNDEMAKEIDKMRDQMN